MNPEPNHKTDLAGDSSGDAGKKVLVVEDELNVAELFLAHLSRFECKPYLARTANEARRLIHRHSFEAAIIDLNLPDENGARLVLEWKKSGVIPRIIITTATANAFPDDSTDWFGADAFLSKPFNISEFDSCFCDYFSGSKNQTAPSYFRLDSLHENAAEKLLRKEGEAALMKKDPAIFGKAAHHFANLSFAASSSDAATSFALAEEDARQGDWMAARTHWHLAWQQL